MRLLGLTLCLLASSFGARAESIEERMTALERQVKSLEGALREQGGRLPGSAEEAIAAGFAEAGSDENNSSNHTLPTPQLASGELTLTGS